MLPNTCRRLCLTTDRHCLNYSIALLVNRGRVGFPDRDERCTKQTTGEEKRQSHVAIGKHCIPASSYAEPRHGARRPVPQTHNDVKHFWTASLQARAAGVIASAYLYTHRTVFRLGFGSWAALGESV